MTNIDTNVNNADIEQSVTSKSRYLFLLFFFGLFIYTSGCSYALYTHKFKKNKVAIPESTLYNPTYK